MITATMIYLVGILDGIKGFFVFAVAVTGVATLLAIGHGSDSASCHEDEASKVWFGWAKKLGAACILCALVNGAIPSSRTAAAMYIIPAIAQDEDMQVIGGNSMKILRDLTEEWLQDLADSESDK